MGEDSFTYKLSPNGQGDEVATVKIKVVELTPNNDTYNIKHDRRLQGSVLGNDLGTPGEPLCAELVGSVRPGTLDFLADGTFLYTPPTAYVGTATFTYRLTNGVETSATNGTVTINVQNTSPVGGSNGYGGGDSYSTYPQRPLVVDFNGGVLANDTDADGDVLTAEILSPLSGGGTLQLNDDGSFTFIPYDSFKGTATFTYKAKDGVTETGPQTVSITVNDNAPTATGQSFSVYHDETLTVGPGTAS